MTRRSAQPSRRTPSGLGTVERMPSGRWRAYYRADGRKFTPGRSFATKDDANAWLASEHADRSRGTWRDPEVGRITLASYAADWLGSRPDLAPRTADYYRRTIDTWIAPRIGATGNSRGIELGAMNVADITPAVVRAWYAVVFTETRQRVADRRTRALTRQTHPARAWALSKGLEVPATGRPSAALLAKWRAAGEPDVTPPRGIPDNAGATAAANAYRVLRTILATAVADGLLTAQPCQIKGAGQVPARERGTASPAEVEQLAAHMPRHLAAAVVLAAWSGLRYGELFALARRHVDLDAGTLRVERALQQLPGRPITFGPTKTAKSRRTVHLPAHVTTRLAAHMAEHVPASPDALLFTLSTGSPVSSPQLSHMFARARAVIARKDLTWHDLRHTGATLAYRAGASVPEVQRRLGHTTMRAASIYAHAADDSDRILAQRLDALIATTATTAPTLRRIGG